MRIEHFRAGIAKLSLAVVVAACAPLASAQSSDDLAPPSTDDDAATAADTAAAEADLAAPLPAGASKAVEIQYLVRQDRALRTLGRNAQRLPVLRRLVELTQGTPQVMQYWPFLWREEWRSGNQAAAFQIGHDILDSKEPSGLGTQTTVAAQMATDYVVANQPEKARPMMDIAEKLRKQFLAQPQPGRADRVNAIVDLEESELSEFDGRYKEAEASLIVAEKEITAELAATEKKDTGPNELSIYQSDLSYERTIFGRHAVVLTQMGRNVEAESIAREGLRRAEAHRSQGQPLGEWYQRIAAASLAERRYGAAYDAATQALTLVQTGGAISASSQSVLWAHGARLQALLGQKRWADASAEYALMLAATANDPVARLNVQSAPLEGLVDSKTGQASAAIEIMTRSVKYRTHAYGENNPRTIESRAVLAVALQSSGNLGAAQSEYHSVFNVLFANDSEYADATPRGLRGYFLPVALESYLDMVATVAASGPVSQDMLIDAFLVADRLRDSRVQQAIVDSAARALVEGNPALLASVRREQDARNGLRHALESLVENDLALNEAKKALGKAKSDKLDIAPYLDKVHTLEGQLDAAKNDVAGYSGKQAEARATLARDFPDYHLLVNPRPIRPADVAALLAPNETFVSLYTSDTHSFLFATRNGDAPVLAVTGLTEVALGHDVADLRDSVSLEGRPTAKPFAFAASYDLYHNLLEPLAPVLAKGNSVIIAESGVLGQLPLALLVKHPVDNNSLENAPWLVRDVAVTHVASASAWAAVKSDKRKVAASLPFMGFGAPDFGSHAKVVPPLPETRAEIEVVARTLNADPAQSTYFGSNASRATVLAAPLATRRVVEFATHGLRAGELPTLSQPALALADAGPDQPWLLTLDDVLTLKLSAQLVVLSACNTASSDGSSAESISGLGRGFFFAGSRAVLVTHWEVETNAAQQLVTDFFTVHGQSKPGGWAEALRQAQLKMISGPNATFHHPAYWAPYALLGDGSS